MRLRQVGSWAHSQLGVQQAADGGEDLQGVRLLTGFRKRQHQQSVRLLVQRVCAHPLPQVRQDRLGGTGLQRRLGVSRHRSRPLPRGHGHRRMAAQDVHIGQGVAAPQAQRPLVPLAYGGGIAVSGGPANQPPEQQPVQVVGAYLHAVARARGDQHALRVARGTAGVDHPSQPADVSLYQINRSGRRSLSPQRVDQRTAVNADAGVEGQEPEHAPLPRIAQRQRAPVAPRGHWPEDVQPQGRARPNRGRRRPRSGSESGLRQLLGWQIKRNRQAIEQYPAGAPGAALLQIPYCRDAHPDEACQRLLGQSGALPPGTNQAKLRNGILSHSCHVGHSSCCRSTGMIHRDSVTRTRGQAHWSASARCIMPGQSPGETRACWPPPGRIRRRGRIRRKQGCTG